MNIDVWPGWYGFGLFKAVHYRRLMLGWITIEWHKKD
jgi:hypothetical protein